MLNLIEEQQNYMNQFKKPQNEFCAQLNAMGFGDEKKNIQMFKRFRGDLEKSIIKLSEKKEKREREPKVEIDVGEVIRKTKILYIDCNNLRYSNQKVRQLQGKDPDLLEKMLQTIIYWLSQPEQQLQEVHLIWDVYKQKNMENLKEQIPKIFKQLIDYQCNRNMAMFYILHQDQIVKFSVQSSQPKIADDLIVELCTVQKNDNTTVVTSDRGLKDRLKQLSVNSFIGNGKWWTLEENQ